MSIIALIITTFLYVSVQLDYMKWHDWCWFSVSFCDAQCWKGNPKSKRSLSSVPLSDDVYWNVPWFCFFQQNRVYWPHVCNQLHYLYLIWLICFVLFIHAVMSNKKTLILKLNTVYLSNIVVIQHKHFTHNFSLMKNLITAILNTTWTETVCTTYH